MSDTSLPWRVFGRMLRPYAFALMCSLISIWLVSSRHVEAIPQMHSGHGHVTGWIALAVAVLLFAGWLAHSDRMMRWGLLLSTGVWGLIATVAAFTQGLLSPYALISACWVAASGGAWLLEQAHARAPGVGR